MGSLVKTMIRRLRGQGRDARADLRTCEACGHLLDIQFGHGKSHRVDVIDESGQFDRLAGSYWYGWQCWPGYDEKRIRLSGNHQFLRRRGDKAEDVSATVYAGRLRELNGHLREGLFAHQQDDA